MHAFTSVYSCNFFFLPAINNKTPDRLRSDGLIRNAYATMPYCERNLLPRALLRALRALFYKIYSSTSFFFISAAMRLKPASMIICQVFALA